MTRRPSEVHRSPASDRDDDAAASAPESVVRTGSRLLEASDVASYLGVRTDWVYREVRAGRLPHIRLGRAVRFRRESIEAWVDARERGVRTGRRR